MMIACDKVVTTSSCSCSHHAIISLANFVVALSLYLRCGNWLRSYWGLVADDVQVWPNKSKNFLAVLGKLPRKYTLVVWDWLALFGKRQQKFDQAETLRINILCTVFYRSEIFGGQLFVVHWGGIIIVVFTAIDQIIFKKHQIAWCPAICRSILLNRQLIINILLLVIEKALGC